MEKIKIFNVKPFRCDCKYCDSKYSYMENIVLFEVPIIIKLCSRHKKEFEENHRTIKWLNKEIYIGGE